MKTMIKNKKAVAFAIRKVAIAVLIIGTVVILLWLMRELLSGALNYVVATIFPG